MIRSTWIGPSPETRARRAPQPRTEPSLSVAHRNGLSVAHGTVTDRDEGLRRDRDDHADCGVLDLVVHAVAVLQAPVERRVLLVVHDRFHASSDLDEAIRVTRIGDGKRHSWFLFKIGELLPGLRVGQLDP